MKSSGSRIAQEKIIRYYIEEISKELTKKKESIASLVSIKIIYPADANLQSSKTVLGLRREIGIQEYKNLDNSFVRGAQDNKLRSLAFQMYDECVKYEDINSETIVLKTLPFISSRDVSKQFDISEEKFDIDYDTVTELLQKHEKLDEYWESWLACIKKEFHYGKATQWSYVVIRRRSRIATYSDKKALYIASAYLIFSNKIEKEIQISINKKCQDLLFELISEHFYGEIETSSVRSAISQVMARNTSHNIGAHVMNKLIDKKYLETFCSYVKGHESCDKNHLKSYQPDKDYIVIDEDHQPFNQIAIFNNYVKCRMDYLADISFGTPMMQTNKYVWQDLFCELDKVRLLLEHISGLSDFNYKIEFKKNGKRFKASKVIESDNEAIEDDLLVAIPNDVLGIQAFYNILENIIRNTAKHGQKDPTSAITTFTINFIDQEQQNATDEQKAIINEFIAVEIYDNINIIGYAENLNNEDKRGYAEDIFKDSSIISKIDWLVYSQNKKLNEDILQDNKLRTSSLGLIEMDASAAYLRKRDVGFINHDNYSIEHDESWSRDKEHKGTNCRYFLKAIKKEDQGKKYLGYRFFLLRPAVVLVVTDSQTDKKYELKRKGIWVITKEEFKRNLENGKVYNHEFILHNKLDEETTKSDTREVKLLEHFKTALPIRILGNIGIEDVLKKETLEELEAFCWKKWEEKLKNLYSIKGDINISNSIKKCKQEPYLEGDFNAIFLDHGQEDWNKYNHCTNVHYLDGLSSEAQKKLPGWNKFERKDMRFYLAELPDIPIQKQQLFASIISKTLVIDERIQNQINNVFLPNTDNEIRYHEVYTMSGILIPPTYPKSPFYIKNNEAIQKSNFNLSADNMSSEFSEALKTYIQYYAEKIFKINDFILIHYSILERIFEQEKDKISGINEFLDSLISDNSPQIVITSGRGTLQNLTSKVRFVNLSPVVTAFVEIRSKYYSDYLLHSSRKNGGIN